MMRILREDHHLSFLRSKNVSMEWWKKMDKTVVKVPNLGNQVTYVHNKPTALASRRECSEGSPVDLPEDLPAYQKFRADQENKLGKDALEDAEFHEYLLSNNQPAY